MQRRKPLRLHRRPIRLPLLELVDPRSVRVGRNHSWLFILAALRRLRKNPSEQSFLALVLGKGGLSLNHLLVRIGSSERKARFVRWCGGQREGKQVVGRMLRRGRGLAHFP